MNKKVMSIIAVIALVAILGVCLVACNAESISNKLEKAGYACEKYEAGKDDDGAKSNGKSLQRRKVSMLTASPLRSSPTQTMQRNMNPTFLSVLSQA